MDDTRVRIGLFGLLIVIVTAGGGLLLLGGGSDEVRTADDLDWLCDRIAVEAVDAPSEPADEPADAVTQAVDGAQLVEAHRSDDEVLLAWVDEDGEALQSHRVVRVDGGWVTDEIQSCEDE
jgi:hypothetical protein